MASKNETTYRSLIKPIPPSINLSNVREQPRSKTCDTCACIVPDRRKEVKNLIKTGYKRIDLYPDFPGLKASAKAGCGLCKFLRKSIRTSWARRPMEEWGRGALREGDGLWDELLAQPWDRQVKIYDVSFSLGETGMNASDTMARPVSYLHLFFGPNSTHNPSMRGDSQHGEISQGLSFKIFVSEDFDSSRECPRRFPSASTLSERNLKLIRSWISDCKWNHDGCSLRPSTWVPTRLLDVGPPDGSQNPRLIETAEEPAGSAYAALTHMWGDSSQIPPLTTIRSNYESMFSCIPMRELPNNFRDAVTVTRKLGLRYIWIDSLCIIQDSNSDWQAEAKTMHLVYKFAEITIAATSATSSHDGFLERNISMLAAAKVDYNLDDEKEAPEYFIATLQDDRETDTWLGDVETSTWNRRGWTLQERALSTRILHFGKNNLYFECRTCIQSEENQMASMSRSFQMWPRHENQMLLSGSALESLKKRVYSSWRSIVQSYSRRSLTKQSDLLPAIQSIAEEMSASINQTYIPLAGMWEEHLDRDLLWQVDDGPVSSPAVYRAPSWSWASLTAKIQWNESPVSFIEPSLIHDFGRWTIKRKWTNYNSDEDDSDSGEICYALNGHALLKQIASISHCDHDDRWLFGTRGTFPYDVWCTRNPQIYHESATSRISDKFNTLSLDKTKELVKFAEARLDFDDKDNLTTSSYELFYMHVTLTNRPSGLILRKCKDSDHRYVRVGSASVFDLKGNLFMESCFLETTTDRITIL